MPPVGGNPFKEAVPFAIYDIWSLMCNVLFSAFWRLMCKFAQRAHSKSVNLDSVCVGRPGAQREPKAFPNNA